MVLADYRTNPDTINHAVVKMLHRVSVDLKMAPLLYQLSVFRTMQAILHEPATGRYKVCVSHYHYHPLTPSLSPAPPLALTITPSHTTPHTITLKPPPLTSLPHIPPLLLENVEHCGGEPERADTGILCH